MSEGQINFEHFRVWQDISRINHKVIDAQNVLPHSTRKLSTKRTESSTGTATRPTPRCQGGRRAPRSSGRRAGALTSAKAGLLFGRTPGLPCSLPWRPARAGRALVSAAPGRAPAASCGHVGHRQRCRPLWQASCCKSC